MSKEKKKKRSPVRIRRILLILVFAAGAGITFYPIISKTWNQYRDRRLLSSYARTVDEIAFDQYDRILADAYAYNDQHLANTFVDVFEEDSENDPLTHPYDTLLNPSGNMVMGYLKIPAISVTLPIYHGTGTNALEKGLGHMQGTSLPVGGPGTHTVLAGHRGLPERKLLTDLDQVKERDLFFICVLKETLAYEVDSILVVEPSETKTLAIQQDQDLATIITCTPYGVNTHRLLVRGHRVPFSEEEFARIEESEKAAVGLEERALIAGLGVFALFVLLQTLNRKRRAGSRKRRPGKRGG